MRTTSILSEIMRPVHAFGNAIGEDDVSFGMEELFLDLDIHVVEEDLDGELVWDQFADGGVSFDFAAKRTRLVELAKMSPVETW